MKFAPRDGVRLMWTTFFSTRCALLVVAFQCLLDCLTTFASPHQSPADLPSRLLLQSSALFPLTSMLFSSSPLPLSFFALTLCSYCHSIPPLPLLPGSLLTHLSVRVQTNPCRAATSRKPQKQLVSLPFPSFLAAVCLATCPSLSTCVFIDPSLSLVGEYCKHILAVCKNFGL